ncbi:MAG: alpha-hydroxy acid oxidase [Sterolibacterium sp.]|nr:alpha-hydroxy acid oxidase [Sterolibacterium sp.]
MPGPIFEYLDGSAETENTAQRNTSAFDDEKLIPKCLVDVTSVSTSTRILGQELAWPVFCAPTGGSRFFHPDGELAVARAAAKSGTLYSLSTMSTYSLEDVAAVSSSPKMFQLYIFKDREVTRELIERCKRSRYTALCITVDCAVAGKRERDLRSGFAAPLRLSASFIGSFSLHPGWLLGQAAKGKLSMANFANSGASSFVAAAKLLNPSLVWKDVREMIELWGGPFAIKGILSTDDARRAVDIGATAVIVSNHGGRQLDGAAASIEVLPKIAKAVGDQVDVILDGGIRRGSHVLKALARGAKACSIGRPYLFGLSAGGEAGVTKALEILRTELIRAMQLSGCTDVRNIDESIVRKF